MSERVSTLTPLARPEYRALWLGTLLSNMGGAIQVVGAGWVMTTMADSHNMVALVQGATALPVVVFSLAAGALADNYDRRSIMLLAQIMMTAVSVALAVLTWMGLLSPWILLAFTFLIGCGTALHNPSWQASVGDLVPREEVAAAVSVNTMALNITRSVGPALGGLVVTAGGAVVAFGLNAVSYLPLIWALWRWKPQRIPSTLPREQFGSAIMAGLRYSYMSPALLVVIFRGFVYGVGAVSVLALLPVVAREYVQGGALSYGTLLGCFGVGAIGGAFLNTRVRMKMSNETIVRLACLAFAASCALLGLSRNALLSHLVLLPAGAAWVMVFSLLNVTIQLSTPRWVVGRTLALYQMAIFGGIAVGSWIWGVCSDLTGPDVALMGASIVFIGCAAIGLRFALPQFGSDNLDPLGGYREPVLKLDVRPRSGPIVITIDYRIPHDKVPEFLQLLAERRRIRRRNGARNWALLHDLERPEIWSEVYHVAAWIDYVRMQQRRTKLDAENSDRLLQLHVGPDVPTVSRRIERQVVPIREDIPLREQPDAPY